MFDSNPNAPFVERLSGPAATLFAVKWCAKMADLRMPADEVRFLIYNARQHDSPEQLEQRARNRVAYFDAKYPPRPYIVTPGDKEWTQ